MPTEDERSLTQRATVAGAGIAIIGLVCANHVGDKIEDCIFGFVIVYVLWLHIYLSIRIGVAAHRRKCGHITWMLLGWFFGPIAVGIVYVLFVHWRPIVQTSPDEYSVLEQSA